jgi:hypothetical protein
MTRNTILRTFVAALVTLGACVVLLLVAGGLAVTGGTLISSGPDVYRFEPGPFIITAIVVAAPALLLALASVVLSLVAWIGALVDTARSPDKTLFVALLVVGVLGMLLIADLIYVLATGGGRTEQTAVTEHRDAAVPESARN